MLCFFYIACDVSITLAEQTSTIKKKLDFKGWTVIRFWGEDIKKHTDECVKVVEETIFDITFEKDDLG